jgi:hypothetical protein
MKNIKIQSLHIEKFKGIELLDLDINGNNLNVYGKNATCKTTIYDAFYWLLFNKNSKGSTNFTIKPVNADGTTKYPGAITTVSAKILVGDEVFNLTKTYFEKWVTKRGNDEQQFEGNTSEYFVDELPVPLNKYKAIINNIIDEDLFKMLTNVYYFNTQMSWQDRRSLLIDIFGEVSEDKLLEMKAEFLPLLEKKEKHNVSDYKKILEGYRKDYNKTKEDNPVRIDEIYKSIIGFDKIDFAGIEGDLKALELEKQDLEQKLNSFSQFENLRELKNSENELTNRLNNLVLQNKEYRLVQTEPPLEKRNIEIAMQVIDTELSSLKFEKQVLTNEVSMLLSSIEFAENRKAGLIEAYTEIEEKATSDIENITEICPSCGQAIQADKIDEIKANIIENAKKKLIEINEKGQLLVSEISKNEELIFTKNAVLKEKEIELSKASEEKDRLLEALSKIVEPVIFDLDNYETDISEISKQLENIRTEIASTSENEYAEKSKISSKIEDINSHINDLRKELQKQTILTSSTDRIEELKAETKEISQKIARINETITLCEDFIRYKVTMSDENINKNFKYAKFNMVKEFIGEGLKEICEVSYNGVPYPDINTAMQINIGLDIINTLSNYYQINVPIFVDNAESINEIASTDKQVILLKVTDNDNEMRFE